MKFPTLLASIAALAAGAQATIDCYMTLRLESVPVEADVYIQTSFNYLYAKMNEYGTTCDTTRWYEYYIGGVSSFSIYDGMSSVAFKYTDPVTGEEVTYGSYMQNIGNCSDASNFTDVFVWGSEGSDIGGYVTSGSSAQQTVE